MTDDDYKRLHDRGVALMMEAQKAYLDAWIGLMELEVNQQLQKVLSRLA